MSENNVPARKEITIGQTVWAVEKRNYGSGQLTKGVVKRILTSKPYHPRGIKVMFEDDVVARVQRLTAPEQNDFGAEPPTESSNESETPEIEVVEDEYTLR